MAEITESQKRHLKKVQKRKQKSLERKEKQLQEQKASGKLIEENHNGFEYSVEFTLKACKHYLNNLFYVKGDYKRYVQLMRPKYQTLLLKWPNNLDRNLEFYLFKSLLEAYWSNCNEEIFINILNNYNAEKTKTTLP